MNSWILKIYKFSLSILNLHEYELNIYKQFSTINNQKRTDIYWAILFLPFYLYSCLVFHAWSYSYVDLATIDAPIKTLYFLVGGSKILIFIEEVDEPLATFSWNKREIYYFKRVGNPGSIDVPPEIKILL